VPRKTKEPIDTSVATIDATLDEEFGAQTGPADEEDWNAEPRIIPETLPHFELEPEPDDDDETEALIDAFHAGTAGAPGPDHAAAAPVIPDAEDVYGDTQLSLPDDLEFDAWENLGSTLIRFARSNAWWLGDWANYGERNYLEEYSQALDAEEHRKELHTVQNYKWVADAIPPERRRAELHWTHHEIVAAMTPDDQDIWLQRAIDEDMSTRDLKKAIKDAQAIEVEHRPANDDADEGPDELEIVYGELYAAVLLAGKLAEECGYRVGTRQETESPGFETIYMDLPDAGQVSWQIPASDIRGTWEEYGPAWDGHTADQRAERIAAYVEFGALLPEGESHAIDPNDDLDDDLADFDDDHTQAGP
jgi:hypothetical protein